MRRELPVLVLAFVASLLAIPAAYAALRAWEVLTMPDPGPPVGVWTPAVALFRRAGVAAYVGGMAGPVVYVLARRRTAVAASALGHAAVVVALLAAAQAIFLP
jgi:hypothetical protein